MVTASFIASQRPQASVYVVGEDALKQELIDRGCKITDRNPDFVVVGFDSIFSINQSISFNH